MLCVWERVMASGVNGMGCGRRRSVCACVFTSSCLCVFVFVLVCVREVDGGVRGLSGWRDVEDGEVGWVGGCCGERW